MSSHVNSNNVTGEISALSPCHRLQSCRSEHGCGMPSADLHAQQAHQCTQHKLQLYRTHLKPLLLEVCIVQDLCHQQCAEQRRAEGQQKASTCGHFNETATVNNATHATAYNTSGSRCGYNQQLDMDTKPVLQRWLLTWSTWAVQCSSSGSPQQMPPWGHHTQWRSTPHADHTCSLAASSTVEPSDAGNK